MAKPSLPKSTNTHKVVRRRVTYIAVACAVCNLVREYPPGEIRKSNPQFCSRKCFQIKHPHTTLTHGMEGSPEYRSYQHAKDRCTNPNSHAWARYGGRGIEFRFVSFQEFYEVLGKRPSLKHSLDRKDNNGHYEKGNVRWATRTEQQANTKKAILITRNGLTLTLHGWCRRLGIGRGVVAQRLRAGWCENCAVSLPANQNNRCSHKKT